MRSRNLTPSTSKPITFSAGVSPTYSIGQCVPSLFQQTEAESTSSFGRHLFSPPLAGQGGSTLFIGLHWFGTSDRIEWPEPVLMRLFCHALVQRLRDDALNDAAICLSGIYDLQSKEEAEPGLVSQG